MIIYKYAIEPGRQEIYLPVDAKILSVQSQRDRPQMWVLLDPLEPAIVRTFGTYPTGNEIDNLNHNEELVHIGTFQLDGGFLVFHTFEIVEVL